MRRISKIYNTLALSMMLLISTIAANEAEACHAIALVNYTQQNATATYIQLRAASNSPTCGCAPYWLDLEVRCMNDPFDGAPFSPGYWGPLTTYPYFQSTKMTKNSCVVQNYPWVTVPFAGLCPGVTYQYRMRENHHGQVGPWTPAMTFTVPGASVNLTGNITASTTNICQGQCATLTANVIQGCQLALSYSWSPGGQTTKSITVCPSTTTNYSVNVVEACSNRQFNANVTVNVVPPAVAGTATINPSTICSGDPVSLTLTGSAGNIQWQSGPSSSGPWANIGGATSANYTDPSVTANTCYRAQVTGCNGNVYSNVVCVTVDPSPVPNFSYTPVCFGFTTSFTDGSTNAVSWQWDFGDGTPGSTAQNPTHTYGGSGSYNVKLIVKSSNGCTDSVTLPVTVYDKPVANLTFDTVCLGGPTSFQDLSTVGGGGSINGWTWNFGDGSPNSSAQNPQHTYGTPGTYNGYLIVTTSDGCSDTLNFTVPISQTPTANFSASTVCLNNMTQFTDLSTVGAGAISQWRWDFGDGSGSSTQKNPSYTYTSPGTYQVKLVAYAGVTCADSITKTVIVNDMPVPGFTFSNECANTSVGFTNTSTIGSGSISGYAWDFGDGSNSTQTSPSHTYTNPGSYNVKLIATSDSGCVDSITQTVTIYALPVTDFSFDTVCLGNQTCFTDKSTVQGSTINGWQWVFGDGSPVGTTQNPCHTYSNPGSYNVTVVVTSADGCTGNASHTILVNDNPTADFSLASVCLDDAASFTDMSTVSAGAVTGWNWDFGDGANSTTKNPTHKYTNPGQYTVQLIASAGTGCSDTITKPINVHPMPVADFNFTDVCDGNPLPLTDLSNISGGTIAGYQWDFGDSQSGSNQNENHNYGGPGQYAVTLIITSDSGCTDTVTKTVEVYPMPQVDYTPTSVCLGVTTQFTDKTNVPGGVAQSWIWNFGDGSANQGGQNPTHTYNQSGQYTTSLIVTTAKGCVDSVSHIVNVNAVPVVDFEADTLNGCDPVCANFTNLVTIASGNIATYSWDFGDGGSSPNADPSHCYNSNSGSLVNYDVTLTVVSDSGCTATLTKQNYIATYPYPIADFIANPDTKPISDGEISFEDKSYGSAKWDWDLGDGDSSTVQNPVHVYKDTGRFAVVLRIENQYGCSDTTWKYIEIEPEFFIYIPNAFTADGDNINDYWHPVVYGVDEMDTYIFDRWGEIIWEGHQLDSKWDGKVKGTTAETEVYVYLVVVKTVLGETKEYRGKVTLLK